MNPLFKKIQSLLKSNRHEDVAIELSEHSITTAAVSSTEEAEPIHPGKRRLKENYTSHWDLDYLPRKEVDRLMSEAKHQQK